MTDTHHYGDFNDFDPCDARDPRSEHYFGVEHPDDNLYAPESPRERLERHYDGPTPPSCGISRVLRGVQPLTDAQVRARLYPPAEKVDLIERAA